MTGAKRLWLRVTCPRVVKSLNIGTDFLILKSWPAFIKEFPSLEKLTIHIHSVNWWSGLNLKLDAIPPTLRKLKFTGSIEFSGAKFFSACKKGQHLALKKFVPQLEVLDLGQMTFSNYSWLRSAPASLTKLKLHKWNGQNILPPGIQAVEVGQLEQSPEDYHSGVVLPLPPKLCKFAILDGKLSSAKTVPFAKIHRSMTSLVLPNLAFSIAKPPDMVSGLPRALT